MLCSAIICHYYLCVWWFFFLFRLKKPHFFVKSCLSFVFFLSFQWQTRICLVLFSVHFLPCSFFVNISFCTWNLITNHFRLWQEHAMRLTKRKQNPFFEWRTSTNLFDRMISMLCRMGNAKLGKIIFLTASHNQ